MMLVRYRVVEKMWPDSREWKVWGAVYENCSGYFPESRLLLLPTLAEHKGVGRYFEARIDRLNPGIEKAGQMIGEYADRFRIRAEIGIVGGNSHEEIRRHLRESIFGEMERPRMEHLVEYAVPEPAYVALREGSEEKD